MKRLGNIGSRVIDNNSTPRGCGLPVVLVKARLNCLFYGRGALQKKVEIGTVTLGAAETSWENYVLGELLGALSGRKLPEFGERKTGKGEVTVAEILRNGKCFFYSSIFETGDY